MKNDEICEYLVEREVQGHWEPVYTVNNFGYVFNFYDSKPGRVINKTKNLVAVLQPGNNFGSMLDWKRLKKA